MNEENLKVEIMETESEALKRDPRLNFYGGTMMAFVPFLVFLIGCVGAALMGYANERVFYIICMFAIVVGLVLAKNKADYFDALVDGMTEKLILTAVMCYIFAGAFGSMLRVSGLVEGLMWLGIKAHLTGGFFCGFAFILGAVYCTAVGSAWATITGLTLFMYPAGIALDADPMVLAGAILSAGAFGDSLAPISDTTIVAATTMERPISDVVRSRLPVTLIAGVICLVLFVVTGGGSGSMDPEIVDDILATADPKGLIMIIPAAVTVFLAFKGYNLIQAISVGVAAVFIIGLPLNMFELDAMLSFKDGVFGGAIVDGVSGFTGLILLIILATGVSYIMQAGGAMERLLDKLQKFATSVRSAEVINWVIMSISASCLGQSIVSIIVGGPLVRTIGDRFKISRLRLANFCSAVHCMWGHSLPWCGSTLLFCTMMKEVSKTYTFIEPINNAVAFMPYTWYAYIIGSIFLIMALTGCFKMEEKTKGDNENEL